MPLLQDSMEEKKFDVRMVEKNLARGRIQQVDVDTQVKQLADDGANVDWITLDSIENAEA